MMKNSFFKICSMILVIVLLVNMLPLQVFAEQLHTEQVEQIEQIGQIGTDTVPSEEVQSSDRIVGEIVQKRTEFSKEFLLDSGLHMAAVYPEAVHYATEDGWEEIDNTLLTKANGTISNTAGVWDVSFPQQLSRDKSITIQKDGYTLSFFMAGELTGGGNAAVMAAGLANEAAEPLAVTGMQTSAAATRMPDLTAMRESMEYEEMVPEKVQSQISYENVYQNTDVIYDLRSNTVKESVILKSYNSTLRGYRYTLDVGEMIPVLEEDGQILFYDAEQEHIVMVMPAPYMIDNAGEYNNDIQVQMTGSGNRYTMTYLLPQQWLAAEDRAWPVILDPVVQPELTTENIRDRTVITNDSFAQDWGMNACGRYSSGKYARTFLKYDKLPALTSSDVVVGATVYMYKPYASSTITTVHAHKVLGAWASETITWDNKPNYDTTIEDYAIVDAVNWYGWDITDVVRGWYAGENTGVMFKASNEIETGSVANFKEFYSSDFGTEPSRPVLSITFRNNNGLESYWDYTSSSAGRAGTGYVNNYTGNLVWVRDDIGFGGNRMPVSISHVYNANDTVENSFGLGNGWRTNYNQLVYPWSADSSYYVWEDSDGTNHYFKYVSDGTYEDEDGLELTLTTTGSGTTKYSITDKNGNISFFDTRGRLTKIQNNQKVKSSINITYSGTSQRIDTITDGVGRKYNFVYNSSGLLTNINYLGSGTSEISYVNFSYNSDNNLISVNDKDGRSSVYTYGTNNLLTSVQNVDGYKLTYTYNTIKDSYQPYRVQKVCEYDGTAQGGTLTFTYAHNQTTLTDHNDNVEIHQFNNMGNTVCIQDDEGHAQYVQFAKNNAEETANKANQLTLSSKLQNTVGNMLNDSSFENSTLWNTVGSGVSVSFSTTQVYYGNQSHWVYTTQAATGIHEQTYTVGPNETVTFSAYVKTGTAAVALSIYDWNGFTATEIQAPNTHWTRLEVSYTNNTDSTKNICPHILTPSAGSFWVDCVQMERSPTASRYNLVENGDFRYGGSSWSSDTGIYQDVTSAPQLENTIFVIPGSPTNPRHLVQIVKVSGSAGDSFVLSGWAKGNAVPLWEKPYETNNREFALQLYFQYANGSLSAPFTVQFNPDSTEWQYAALAAIAPQAYSSILIQVVYDYNENFIICDGIQLFREEFGTSYTYDADGNVRSVTDLQKQTTTYEYNTNNDLTKVIQDNKAKMTYEYDDYHNVKTATTEMGAVYAFTYDDYGNNTKVSIDDTPSMMSTATYSADGNRLVSTTDALGKITTYSYNADTNVLEWVQNPEDTEATRTNYTYDEMYRLAMVSCITDRENSLYAAYEYEDDRLVDLSTPTQGYVFNYGDFGLRSSVKVADRTLADYLYTEDGNNYLSRLDYDNGDRVNYSYDDKGRLFTETFEDGDTVSYAYNSMGDLAKVTDSESGITTTYYYDLIDRMVKYREVGTNLDHSVTYTYDAQNNLSTLVENIDGDTHTTTYTYDEDNRLISVNNGTVSSGCDYDYCGRIRARYNMVQNGTMLMTHYNYHTYVDSNEPQEQYAGTQLSSTYWEIDGYLLEFSYTYDDNGNILTASHGTYYIPDGIYTTSYEYDSANQLIRENNQAGNFTHTWEYDNAGNILNRKEYAYTTGSLEGVTPTDTVTYTYGDSTWGDLLTGYDGQNISYDAIGNPTSDGTWNYTWEHGRELASMSNGTTTWSFVYDANGMRTQKSNGATTYKYVYNGSSLSQMTVGNDKLHFAYDTVGTPMSVTYNGTNYYYVTNIQGDVIEILTSSGYPVVTYSYDAWGNILSTTGSMASTLGTLNPLRYRGYVYDTETGLYYVSSRYYDPEIGRWINADSLLNQESVLGNNMFAYCLNNPVNMADTTGELPFFLVTAAIGAVAGAIIGGVVAAKNGGNVWAGIGIGAAAGGLAGAGLGAAAGVMLAGSATASTAAVASGAGMLATAVSTGGAGAGLALVADNISRAVNNVGTVLYSGGEQARQAATTFANNTGGTTIDPTVIGQVADAATKVPGAAFTTVWSQASATFCHQASGVVNAFVSNSAYRGVDSIFWSVEMPTLLSNPRVTEIIIHIFE